MEFNEDFGCMVVICVAIIAAVTVCVLGFCSDQHQRELKHDIQMQCIRSGGEWLNDSCVRNRQ